MTTTGIGTRLRRAHRAPAERGAATLEIVILFPVVLLITFGVIEGALWYHARNIALAAAQEGAEVASAADSSLGAGAARAAEFAATAGSDGMLTNVSIGSSGGAEQVTITVSGNSLSLFPGWGGMRISQTASAPVERFTTPG